ncbi:hypothetical protein AgCh_001529 [Apium graveolens]
MAMLRRTARNSVPGGPYRVEGFRLPEQVVANLGLVVPVYDIKSINGGFVFLSDGVSTYTVSFRLVIFRPFVGEVVTAKLLESTVNGLRCNVF